MAGTLTPTPYQTVLDDDGVAVSGAKINTYDAGTTDRATTYTTSDLSVANANPIIADSAGRYVAYLPAGANLRFIIQTSADVTIDDQDNILSVPGASVNLDLEGTVGEAVTAGQVLYLSSGAEASPLTAGLWYLTDADAAPTSTTAQTIGVAVSAIAINTSGTIRLAGLVTTAGSVVVGTTYYVSEDPPGAITSSAPALSRQVGVAMTTSTLVLAATTVVAASIPNPISQDLLFVDNTYDIGKSGATRPRDLFASRNAVIGGTLGVTGTASLGTVGTGTWQGTAVTVPYGGTGATSLTDGGVLLGSGTGAVTAMSVLADSEMIVGDGSTDPVAESGATLRTSIGVGTGDSPTFTAVTVGQVDVTGEGDLRLQDNTGGQFVGFDAPSAVSTSYTMTFPAAIGSVDQALTINNVDGTLQWATISADAAGSDTQVQFNDGGTAFGGDAGLTYNKTTDALTVAGDLVVDTTTLFVDASEDRVGIGTDAPEKLFHVKEGDAASAAAVDLNCHAVFESDDAMFVSIQIPASVSAGFVFATPNHALDGGMVYTHNTTEASSTLVLTAGHENSLTCSGAGNVAVSGALSKGSGSFNIQHPLPSKADTHRLVHSFIEGPKCDLIYRGTVALVDGTASQDLDEAAGMSSGTWILLCRDEQVFSTNETGWFHVRGSIAGSTLTIDCEEATCTDTVSWMVVASRKDTHIMETDWTDEEGYPIVEPLKPEEPEP